jgi:hypothetical protein
MCGHASRPQPAGLQPAQPRSKQSGRPPAGAQQHSSCRLPPQAPLPPRHRACATACASRSASCWAGMQPLLLV